MCLEIILPPGAHVKLKIFRDEDLPPLSFLHKQYIPMAWLVCENIGNIDPHTFRAQSLSSHSPYLGG